MNNLKNDITKYKDYLSEQKDIARKTFKCTKIEYYNETWGYFCNLRRISFWLFLKNMPSYIYKTPWIALKKNLFDFFRK